MPLQKSAFGDIYYPTLRTLQDVPHCRSCLTIWNDRRFGIFESRMLKNRVCFLSIGMGNI